MSILVYTQNWEGKFKKTSYELVSYASELAKVLNTSVVALTIGNVDDEEIKSLGKYGASKMLVFNNDKAKYLENKVYSSVIAQAASKEDAKAVILSHNFSGKALAPRLSVKLKAGFVSNVVELPSSLEPFVIKNRTFTGKAFSNIEVKSEIKILTLGNNSFKLIENNVEIATESFEPELSDSDFKTVVKDVNKVAGKILLTDAEIVVAGGRGMKGGEYWGPLEELAAELGAATACSRPVSDEGWRPHEEHTGQTGKIIAPNLYFALGISGAIQHIAGVSSSKFIVAVNKDEEAPVFDVADYGIIGDVHKVLPELVNAVKKFKSEQ